MVIQFSCLQCGVKFKVSDEFAGRASKCSACKHPLVVPIVEQTQAFVPGVLDGTASSLDQAGHAAGLSWPFASDEAENSRPRDGKRYVLEEEIARGGMGAILRAIDRDLRREVAIKFMLGEQDTQKITRFVEEAQITGQLEHPNIVPIHELGIDAQKRFFFTMKMVHGRSLAQIVTELRDTPRLAEKTWTLSRLLTILVSICHALAYAHSRRVIHRDLKPANIMVGDFGEVYVMDWGLAKVLAEQVAPVITVAHRFRGATRTMPEDPSGAAGSSSKVETNRRDEDDLTQDGAVVGTPVYMPPEQARGEVTEIDERSDIYSLGAILYELLTLVPPIDKAGGYRAILSRVADGDIVAPPERTLDRFRQGKIPPELAAICMKALATEPARRYQTVEKLRRDIERFQEGRSVSAKDDTKREMMTKFVKRNKGFSATSAVALVVLVTVVSFFSRINYTARLHAEEQERQAVKSKLDSEQSQRDKEKTVRESLPAFLGAARQLSNDGKITGALKQVEIALLYDADNPGAHLLRGQVFLAQKQWPQAQAELKQCLQQIPNNKDARTLLALSRGDLKDPAVLFPIAEELQRQKLNGLAAILYKDVQLTVANRAPLLKLYQKQIDTAWEGRGKWLTVEANGEFALNLSGEKKATGLQPLEGMQLHRLNLLQCSNLADLEPLRGMALTHLNISGCKKIEDLGPLRDMPLLELQLRDCDRIVDLEPLRGMRLAKLELGLCSQIRDVRPLAQMPLTHLALTNCRELTDLRPLEGNRDLIELIISGCKVSSLEPLRDMPLQKLWMEGALVPDLEPLRKMPLQFLHLRSCANIQDLSPLRGLPLTHLNMAQCGTIRDLTPLAGMKLQSINFLPKYIEKGMEAIRRMQSLTTISMDSQADFTPDEFWKRYDAGEFRK